LLTGTDIFCLSALIGTAKAFAVDPFERADHPKSYDEHPHPVNMEFLLLPLPVGKTIKIMEN